MNNINFTARFIRNAQVQKRNDKEEYVPSNVSIVELDKFDERDVKSLYNTAVLWNEQGAKYSSNIFHEAVKGYEYDDILHEHYFAVTEQKDGFDNLDSNKVLGLMLFSNSRYDSDEITWLQVRPNTNAKQSWKREYKGIGSALIGLVKQISYCKPVNAVAVPEAEEFYKKQGFESHEDDIPLSLYWEG